MIDLDRYPIHDRTLAAYVAVLDPLLHTYRDQGWCRIAGFLRASAIESLVREAAQLAPLGHRPGEVPSMVTVAADLFSAVSNLRAIHQSDDVVAFLADVSSTPTLARSADALTGLNLTVMLNGDASPGERVAAGVTAYLLVQGAGQGGSTILAAADTTTVEVDLAPGDLLVVDRTRLDRRVGPVSGPTPRYEARLALRTHSDDTVSDAQKLVTYGRLVAQRRRG